ncbi:sulfatase [bacterium]|nr:sulfatase [bacterium]
MMSQDKRKRGDTVSGVSTRSRYRWLAFLAGCSLVFLLSTCQPHSVVTPDRIDTVLLLVVDSLRQDHVGAYGYDRSVTPELDRLSRQGIQFCHAVAQGPWTKPSMASILSGLYPRTHVTSDMYDRLDPAIQLMPTFLRAQGFQTCAFSANSVIVPETGFAQGFDQFHFKELLLQNAEIINRSVVHMLEALPRTERLFAYIHYMDPHFPYLPGEPVFSRENTIVFDLDFFGQQKHLDFLDKPVLKKRLHSELINAYDDGIRFNDRMIGRLLDHLRARGRLDTTLVILTADHGEELLEHQGVTHGQSLFDELVMVPLLISFPGSKSRIETRLVEQVDLCPTLLGLLRTKLPKVLEGQDLFRTSPKGWTYSELELHGRRATSVRSATNKLIDYSQYWEAEDTIRWFQKRAEIPNVSGPTFIFEIMSFHKPRLLDVRLNGQYLKHLTILPHWSTFELNLPNQAKGTITLEARGDCDSPFELGQGHDTRCFSFCLRNSNQVAIQETRERVMVYFDLIEDPTEQKNMLDRPDSSIDLTQIQQTLECYRQKAGTTFHKQVLLPTDEMQTQLRMLGYIE